MNKKNSKNIGHVKLNKFNLPFSLLVDFNVVPSFYVTFHNLIMITKTLLFEYRNFFGNGNNFIKVVVQMDFQQYEEIMFEQLIKAEDRFVQDYIIRNKTIEGEQLSRMQLVNVVFERCIFINCDFSRWDVTDSVFKHCDLSNCRLEEGFYYRTTFINCKLIGTKFTKSRFKQSSFSQCFANYVSFSEANFDQTSFVQSTMNDSDFYQVTHKQLELSGCELNAANFEETKLKGLDVSSSFFEELYVDVAKLKGLKIAPQQAAIFTALLGIEIAE